MIPVLLGVAKSGALRLTSAAIALALVVSLAGCGSGDAPPADSTPTTPAVKGRVLYVAPGGSDEATGSRGRPFRTIQRAADELEPGDSVVVAPGTYPDDLTLERSGTSAAPVTLTSRGGERPVLTGRLKVTASNVVVSGLVFQGRTAANPEDVAVYVSGGHSVVLDGNEVRDAAQSGVFVGEGATGVRITRNWIHDNGKTVLDHGIYFENGSDAVIASNLIERSFGYGIQLYPNADDVLVTQNTIVKNGRSGVIVGGEERTADRNRIVNNIVALNREQGIRSFWGGPLGTGNVAEQNLVWKNGEDGGVESAGLVVLATIEADPLFVDASGGDFSLRAGSPALGQALPSYSQPTDFDGTTRPQGEGPDLGAFERPEGSGP